MKLTPEIAALYIGCDVQTKLRVATEQGKPMKKLKGKLMEVDLGMQTKLGIHLENEPDKCTYVYLSCEDVKLLLRPLSKLNEEEKSAFNRMKQNKGFMAQVHASNTLWLLSKQIDLFGLIDDGSAIDQTKEQNND